MRAGRLLHLLLLLQNGGRMTAGELARRLEVSPRTVLRDLDELSSAGVPVYATRGAHGGFQLLDTFEQRVPTPVAGLQRSQGRHRVRVRIAPVALQIALVRGVPAGWRPRPRPDEHDDRPDWIEGSFRYDSPDAVLRDLLALGADVEVLLPVELRVEMADLSRRVLRLHQDHRPTTGHTASSA
jgi:predicted DNA-binding transcriptional regulator YafY